MNQDAEQQDTEQQDADRQETAAGEQPPRSGQTTGAVQGGTTPPAKRRAGVPVWRTGKPDAYLAAAVDVARAAVEGITAPADIGPHIAAKSEGERLVTHLFESRLPGYQGWQWYAVVTRNSRSKVVTVSELGLLPSENSILSPEWVPWAERVRPEDAQAAEDEQHPAASADAGQPEDGEELPGELDPEEDQPAREAD